MTSVEPLHWLQRTNDAIMGFQHVTVACDGQRLLSVCHHHGRLHTQPFKPLMIPGSARVEADEAGSVRQAAVGICLSAKAWPAQQLPW